MEQPNIINLYWRATKLLGANFIFIIGFITVALPLLILAAMFRNADIIIEIAARVTNYGQHLEYENQQLIKEFEDLNDKKNGPAGWG